MKLAVIDVPLSVCKVADAGEIDLTAGLVFVAHTADELSLVCPEDAVPRHTIAREDGWRALRFEGTLDFGLVGILADIARVLADANVSIFAVSTFDTDYVLVRQACLERAICALEAAGYDV